MPGAGLLSILRLSCFIAGLVATDSPFGALDGAGTYTFEFARPLRTSDVLQQV